MLYFAIILYHGIVWKPSYAHYYTENAIFATPMIRKILSYNRFLFINFLHFVANSTFQKSIATLAWNHLSYVKLHQDMYGVVFFIPAKNSPKTSILSTETLSMLHWKSLSLIDKLLDKGYHLFIDKWHTSFEIAHTLFHHETDVIGTLHKDRKNLLHIVKTKLNIGEHVVQYKKNTDLMCTHWEDKKDVYIYYPPVLRK